MLSNFTQLLFQLVTSTLQSRTVPPTLQPPAAHSQRIFCPKASLPTGDTHRLHFIDIPEVQNTTTQLRPPWNIPGDACAASLLTLRQCGGLDSSPDYHRLTGARLSPSPRGLWTPSLFTLQMLRRRRRDDLRESCNSKKQVPTLNSFPWSHIPSLSF